MSKLTHHRAQWKTHIGFLFAAIGSSIGLGNIWRFPYICYKNGGAAFLIPYIVALFVVGIPIMLLEISLGHKMRGSAPASFASISKKWEWLGWWCIIFVMFGIVLYYSVVISWCLNYFIFSFSLKWKETGIPTDIFFRQFIGISDMQGNAIHNSVYPLGNISTLILGGVLGVWLINWIIVYLGVQKGLERAGKLFMPLLFFIVLFLTLWSLKLEGAWDGIKVYILPDWDKLKDIKVWTAAFAQIFFSLSLGFGIMIAYASYLPREIRLTRDAFVICLADSIFSIIAGFGVFSIVGYMSYKTGKPILEVVTDPLSLAFVVYPETISLLPSFSHLFGCLFFLSLVIAGITSSISILEAFTSGIEDKFHYNRKRVVSVLSIIGFLGSIVFTTQAGIYWLDIVDHFLNYYGLILVGFLECIVVGWFYRGKLKTYIDRYSGIKIGTLWDILVKVFAPSALLFLFIGALSEEIKAPYGNYPRLANVLIGYEWLIKTFLISLIVAAHPWKIEPKDRKHD